MLNFALWSFKINLLPVEFASLGVTDTTILDIPSRIEFGIVPNVKSSENKMK